MNPEVIGSVVGTLVAIGAGVGAIAATIQSKNAKKRDALPDEIQPQQPEPTGRFRLVDELVLEQSTGDILGIVTEIHRKLHRLTKAQAKEARDAETVAELLELVEMVHSRVRRTVTTDVLRDEIGGLRRELLGALRALEVDVVRIKSLLERLEKR